MLKNGMWPIHPGEIFLEDYIKPMGISIRALSLAMTIEKLKFPSVRHLVSEAEWQTRVDLAAAYRLVALFGWDDIIPAGFLIHSTVHAPCGTALAGV